MSELKVLQRQLCPFSSRINEPTLEVHGSACVEQGDVNERGVIHPGVAWDRKGVVTVPGVGPVTLDSSQTLCPATQ